VRIAVLNNLRAGESKAKVSRMLSFLKEHPSIPHVETENNEHVRDALMILQRQGMEVLAVNGGDGTLQRVLSEILGSPIDAPLPLIAPLRGGRTNMSARDIGSHRNPVVALSALLRAIQQGALVQHIVERPVLRIDLGAHCPVQYGMFFGVGVMYRTIELKHRILPKRYFQGLLGSGAFVGTLVTRAIFGSMRGLLTPDTVEVYLDDQQGWADEFLLIMATTLDRLFLRMQPFWGQEVAPVRLTAIAAGARRSFSGALQVVCGYAPDTNIQKTGYASRNVHKVSLRLDCGVIIDGELFPPQPARLVSITADHRIRFVCS
jgi:diacylglycerol kinase (ATP)